MIRRDLSPAALGSIALHVGVAVALLISWPWSKDLKVGAVVPVTIVANAPATDLAPAEHAPVEQTAQTEAPVPDAPAEVVPPPPQPTPTPPAPAPKPVPTPAPTKAVEKPAPQKPQPKPEKSLDFDALLASLPKSKSAAPKASSAPKGPTRAATAPEARPNLGSGNAAAALSGLTEELQRRWNPNCEVEGGRDVAVRVTFQIGAGGQLVGEPAAQIRGGQPGVAQAAVDRAIRAVYAASPFRNLPREFYGERIAVNFNAREACS